jgi:hypothetical protein
VDFLVGRPVLNLRRGEYGANSRGRYLGTGEIKPSGLSTPAEVTGKMVENSEPPPGTEFCTFITMPQGGRSPHRPLPLFREISRLSNILQSNVN